MKLISHPNVVDLYEVMSTKMYIYLVMELVKGNDLLDYMSKVFKVEISNISSLEF